MQVSYKHSSALWRCNPYSTPKLDKSHCFSLPLLLHFPFLRTHHKNERAQQSHKQNNLKTYKLMIPNQTRILSLKEKKKKAPRTLRVCLGYNIRLKTRLNMHEPKHGTLALISVIDREDVRKKKKKRKPPQHHHRHPLLYSLLCLGSTKNSPETGYLYSYLQLGYFFFSFSSHFNSHLEELKNGGC